jgi:hypothetical protein
MLSWTKVTNATAYRVYQTTDATFTQAGNSNPSQFSVYSPAATSMVTLVHDSIISLGVPVATAVNVAGAGTISNVVKLTVAVAV